MHSPLALLAGLLEAFAFTIRSLALRKAGLQGETGLFDGHSRGEVTRRIDRQAEPGDQFGRLIEIVQ